MIRKLIFVTAAAGLLVAGLSAAPASAHDHHRPPSVRISGAVATPAAYTAADLRAMEQVTLPDLRSRPGGTVTGVSLEPMVGTAQPLTPTGKNTRLRVTLTVGGRHHQRLAIALGELDPRFGDHPALIVPASHRERRGDSVVLAASSRRPGLPAYGRSGHVDPGRHRRSAAGGHPARGRDRDPHRRHTRILTVEELGRLRVKTRTVTFQSGIGQQTHTESGPTLSAVLRAAHLRTGRATTVAAVGSDGYIATVTPAEATAGRRPLLLSTNEDGQPLHPAAVGHRRRHRRWPLRIRRSHAARQPRPIGRRLQQVGQRDTRIGEVVENDRSR